MNKEVIEDIDNKSKYNPNSFSDYVSLILAIFPLALIAYCYYMSGGSFSTGDRGAVWWFVLIYYWTVGIPFFIFSYVLAINNKIKRKSKLSVFCFYLGTIKLVIVAILFIYYNIASYRERKEREEKYRSVLTYNIVNGTYR